MIDILRKTYYLYKVMVWDEVLDLKRRQFANFNVSLCVDFKIFTAKDEVTKYCNKFKLSNNIDKIFYARFEVDEDSFRYVFDRRDENRSILITKDKFEELNLHVIGIDKVNQVFEYNNSLIDIPSWISSGLLEEGVLFNSEYFDYIYSFEKALKTSYSNLFLADFCNRIYKNKLGRIVVYKDEPAFYDDVWSAVFDNYNKRYKFGFEKLHEKGIFPALKNTRCVTKFGVSIKEKTTPVEHPCIAALNAEIKYIYRWKYGKMAISCYNDPCCRDQDDGQLLEEFKIKHVRYCCFIALHSMDYNLKFYNGGNEKNQAGSINFYFEDIESILNRYSCDGNTMFEKVENLNDYNDYSGIYILCFDSESKMYIGQTKKCLKTRILQHFIAPQSDFDKNHSLEDVTSIFVLKCKEEYLNAIEADCIASVFTESLHNRFAGGGSIEMIKSGSYIRERYLLDNKYISMIVEEIKNQVEI